MKRLSVAARRSWCTGALVFLAASNSVLAQSRITRSDALEGLARPGGGGSLGAFYFLAARHLAVLREHPAWSGVVFGVLVYLFMNFVVIPLSAFPLKVSYPPRVLIRGFLSHAFLVGLSIALSVRRLSFREARRADA